jgi:eukaryotic-like serine/threonine-protein kinase
MQEALPAYREDTDWRAFHVPRIESAAALERNQPGAAIEALKAALPYDLRNYEAPSRRGLAYLAAHNPQAATGEFEKVIKHPGVDPVSYYVPLAHLGLGRARAMAGDAIAARVEYEVFFAQWKDADAGLALMKQARAEYAAIR